MIYRENLAIVGSGPSAIYLLKHFLSESSLLKDHLGEISIFEKTGLTGTGMPYSPLTTDRYNMSNISSEELPDLIDPFADWLRAQEPSVLKELDLEKVEISDSGIYSRLALGQYLRAQYHAIVTELEAAGVRVLEFPGSEIVDLRDDPESDRIHLVTGDGNTHSFHRAILATGHYWPEEDKPECGYYASPWPMSKLIPASGQFHDFSIGILGASLSAFDVVSSLAHRHGEFTEKNGHLIYRPHPGTENFKIVMHSSEGLLPHLQFEQVEPCREIYRHFSREELRELFDENGSLGLETYFDRLCRPVLQRAFEKDGMPEMVGSLSDPHFGIADFAEKMTDKHEYNDAFEGMRVELAEAEKTVLADRPVHWKEALDDLMYSLNFHAERMPAEDHLLLRQHFMPFLMNVIAAMPLPSAGTILALHDAGKLSLVAGRVEVDKIQSAKGATSITVEHEEKSSSADFRMFIDCSGQKPLEVKDFPFPSLVSAGSIRNARAPFIRPEAIPSDDDVHLVGENGSWYYEIGGLDIDAAYRVIGRDGTANPRLFDIAFPHTSGIRPYSYGLQACNETGAILVQSLKEKYLSRDTTGQV